MAEVKIKEPDLKAVQPAKGTKQPKKKKKNAPDRPQPAWLFPPDAENPVLNPKIKTEAEERKEYEDRMEAIKFLRHKAVSAPLKTAPPTQLLTLIGAFLASYGFISTGRIFSLERNARKKLDGWDDHIGKKLSKGTPDLVKIYKDWSKDYYEESGSENEDDNEETKAARAGRQSRKLQERQLNAAEETSSSGSEQSSSSEEEATIKSKNGAKQNAVKKGKAGRIPSESSSTSTSDSDADDEKGVAAKPSTAQPTVARLVNKLKRKAAPGGSSSTDSSTDSDSELGSSSNEPAKKKKKSESAQAPKKSVSRSNTVDTKAANSKTTKSCKADAGPATANTKPSKNKIKLLKSEPIPEQSAKKPAEPVPEKEIVKTASSSNSSSDSSSKKISSSSHSDTSASHSSNPTKKTPTIPAAEQLTNGRKDSTDSSTTLNGTSTKKPTATKPVSSSSSSDTSSSSDHGIPLSEPTTTHAMKRKRSPSPKAITPPPKSPAKRSKKPSAPFSRIPQDTKVDPKLASNAYVPYDYAEKAHQDLSVTNGKGFKKEKNKKKRGA